LTNAVSLLEVIVIGTMTFVPSRGTLIVEMTRETVMGTCTDGSIEAPPPHPAGAITAPAQTKASIVRSGLEMKLMLNSHRNELVILPESYRH